MTTKTADHDASLLALASMLRKNGWRLHTHEPGRLIIPSELRGPTSPHRVVKAPGAGGRPWLWFDGGPSGRDAICPAERLDLALDLIVQKLEATAPRKPRTTTGKAH